MTTGGFEGKMLEGAFESSHRTASSHARHIFKVVRRCCVRKDDRTGLKFVFCLYAPKRKEWRIVLLKCA